MPRLMAELVVQHPDRTVDTIGSDDTLEGEIRPYQTG